MDVSFKPAILSFGMFDSFVKSDRQFVIAKTKATIRSQRPHFTHILTLSSRIVGMCGGKGYRFPRALATIDKEEIMDGIGSHSAELPSWPQNCYFHFGNYGVSERLWFASPS
jgi:hypothetical protein